MSFHVGQKVVVLHDCVDSDMTRPLLKDNIETVESIRSCKCKKTYISVGIKNTHIETCNSCKLCCYDMKDSVNIFFESPFFAPIQEKREHNKCEIKIKVTSPIKEVSDKPIKEPVEV